MLKTALLSLVSSGLLATAIVLPPQSAESASTKLHAGQSLRATLSVQQIGGQASQIELSFSKPDSAKIETPERLLLTDGATMTELDKKANTYSTTEHTDLSLLAWINKPESFAWTPFFQEDLKKLVASSRSGTKRKVRSVDVTITPVTLTNRDTAELYIEDATGLVRGYSYTKEGKTWIVWATKLEYSDKPLEADFFAFTPPAGATEAKTMQNAADWASVASIFKARCMPCHSGGRASSGLNLENYESTSKHAAVVPGNAANSRLVRSIKGQGRTMPPTGPLLSSEDVAKIETWINAGAKQ